MWHTLLLITVQWTCASTVGAILSAIIAKWEPPFGLVLAGMIFPIPQWLVLRKHLVSSSWWVPVTAAGMLAAFSLEVVLALAVERPGGAGGSSVPVTALFVGGPIGIVVGLGQSGILTRGRRIMVWILASGLGAVLWVLLMVFSRILSAEVHMSLGSGDTLTGMGIGGMTYGLVTGFVLAHLVVSNN